MRHIFSAFLGFLIVFSADSVFAQDRLPPIGKINEKDKITLPIPQSRNLPSAFNNEYLEDTLRLQYQITLLERMIQRQGSIARLEKNYIELGLPFSQPMPPRGICEELPANIPCYRAYPELYDVILPDIQPLDILAEDALNVEMLETEQRPINTSVSLEPPVSTPENFQSDLYNWVEVLCGGGVCSAVVIREGNSKTRRTVQKGQTLEKGVIEVLEISSEGVVFKEVGKEISLSPARAPSDGGPSSPIFADRQQVQQAPAPLVGGIEDLINQDEIPSLPIQVEQTAGTPAPQVNTVAPEPLTTEPVIDPGPPPVGATGLF